jgi:ribosomal protein L18
MAPTDNTNAYPGRVLTYRNGGDHRLLVQRTGEDTYIWQINDKQGNIRAMAAANLGQLIGVMDAGNWA